MFFQNEVHEDQFDAMYSNSSNIQENDKEHRDEKQKKQKGNTKNTYIKKISSLMKISNNELASCDQPNEKKQMIQKAQSQVQLDHSNDKLAKNRESARNSRKRKKIYLELLENKVTKLSEQLETYKKIYEKNQELALNLQTKINQKKREQEHTKLILFTNLQSSIQNNTSENNIDSIIESLNKKFGSGALDRQIQLDHYTKQIIENCFSPYANYIISIARNNSDIFNTNGVQENEQNPQILKKLKLTDKQKQILQKKKSKMLRSYQEVANSLQQINDTKSSIQLELNSLDQTLELLRKELKPSQVARFLLAIEKRDIQGQFREPFEKCFGAVRKEQLEDDDSLDLYQFMAEHNVCNSLGFDVQSTYDIYRQSNDFLQGKIETEDQKNSQGQ